MQVHGQKQTQPKKKKKNKMYLAGLHLENLPREGGERKWVLKNLGGGGGGNAFSNFMHTRLSLAV